MVAQAGPAGGGDMKNPHFRDFPSLGIRLLNHPSPSKTRKPGLFPWRASLGLELDSNVVSHRVLLFALIMEWRRKVKKVKAGSVPLDFTFIKLCFWRLLPGVLPVASSLLPES